MAPPRITATSNDTHVTITFTRATAERMAELLDTTGDWFGNMQASDLGITKYQFESGVADIEKLASLLDGYHGKKPSG